MSLVIPWQERDRLWLPDQNMWGRGYGGKGLTLTDLNETAASIAARPPYNYGPRLLVSTPGFEIRDNEFRLPSGFDAMNYPGRQNIPDHLLEPDTATSPPDEPVPWYVPWKLQELYLDQGYALDQNGRACNPHGTSLCLHGQPGLNTNLGAAWWGGETIEVEIIVANASHVLLQTGRRRGSNGEVEFPLIMRGVVMPEDYGISTTDWVQRNRRVSLEGIHAAVPRIVQEQSGIVLSTSTHIDIVWGYRPSGAFQTWNAWNLVYVVRAWVTRDMQDWATPIRPSLKAKWHTTERVQEYVGLMDVDQQRSYKAAMGG